MMRRPWTFGCVHMARAQPSRAEIAAEVPRGVPRREPTPLNAAPVVTLYAQVDQMALAVRPGRP